MKLFKTSLFIGLVILLATSCKKSGSDTGALQTQTTTTTYPDGRTETTTLNAATGETTNTQIEANGNWHKSNVVPTPFGGNNQITTHSDGSSTSYTWTAKGVYDISMVAIDGTHTQYHIDNNTGLASGSITDPDGQIITTGTQTTDPLTQRITLDMKNWNPDGTLHDESIKITEANGQLVQSELITTDAKKGNTLDELKHFNADGSLQNTTTTTTSADGLKIVIKRDTNGDGRIEQKETLTTNANGLTTDHIQNLNADGSLIDETTTQTRAMRTKKSTTGATGLKVDDIKNFNSDGTLKNETITQTSIDGLTIDFQRDSNGDGLIDQTEHQVKSSSGQKISDIKNLNRDGTLKNEKLIQTQADGSSITKITQSDGAYSLRTDDGQGKIKTDHFDANGFKKSDRWQKADGTHGTDTFKPDGSYKTTNYHVDGSYELGWYNDPLKPVREASYTTDRVLLEEKGVTIVGGYEVHYDTIYLPNGSYDRSWSAPVNGSHGTEHYDSATHTLSYQTYVAASVTPTTVPDPFHNVNFFG